MMNEISIMIYLPLTGFLFAFGGYREKGWRRWGIPILTAAFLIHSGIQPMRAILASGILAGVLTLGYSPERKTWLVISMIACAYSIPTAIIGWTIFIVILPVFFVAGLWMSNSKWFHKDVPHKVWEFGVGVLIAMSMIGAV